MSYRASPLRRRRRRTKAEIEALERAIHGYLEEHRPATVRQVFYAMVSRGVVDKSESAYQSIVVRLTRTRESGFIPFSWVADNTRWQRKPASFGDLRECLESTAAAYRRQLWLDQPTYTEVWLEKDALAGVLYRVTARFDVPLMVTRGYPSLSFLHGAGEAIRQRRKPTHVYYFGDRDPSGVDIPRNVERRLREYARGVPLHFHHAAVTPEQIEAWNLPTRPTKQTDSRAKNFDGESVELDAIPVEQLRALVRQCIERHIDPHQLETTRRIEALEREQLEDLAETLED